MAKNDQAEKLYWQAEDHYNNKEYAQAVNLFIQAAQKGNIPAKARLGYCYQQGIGIAADPTYAIYWLSQASDAGNASAQANLGHAYYNGLGIPRDYAKAAVMFQKAADQNHKIGTYNLAVCYEFGRGVAQNRTRAMQLYKKAAEMGYEDARKKYEKMRSDLGLGKDQELEGKRLHQEGNEYYGKKQYDKAFELFQKAAGLGYVPAQSDVGWSYHYGYGVKKNEQLAFYWYKKAADQDLPSAINQVGVCYKNGIGVAKDLTMAVDCYKRAADKNVSVAAYNLAQCYELGQGTYQDKHKALEYYKKAMELGWKDAGPKYEELKKELEKPSAGKGSFYANDACVGCGMCVDKCPQRNIRFENGMPVWGSSCVQCMKCKYNCPVHAVEYGERKSPQMQQEDPEKLFQQGLQHYNNKQYDKALPLFQKAAELGNEKGQYYMGWCVQNGFGTAVDYGKALQWYQKSANGGYSFAMNQIGYFYEVGWSVQQNREKAFYWYQKAAEKNVPVALNNVGVFYEYGITVAVDKQKALEYYKKSADLGREDGKKNYDRLKAELEKSGAAPKAPPKPAEDPSGMTGQQELDALTGLDNVKREIRGMVSLMQYQQERKKQNKPVTDFSRHMVFTGNPGTGKTTVARIVAKIYHELGLIEKPTVVEVDRSDLVAEYIGQTAPKTKKKIEEAMGGILFIDEAYTLAKAKDSPNDFGQEAIDTLLKEMEDHRDQLIVIAAGYTKEMHAFISSNPGLKSRFNTFIEFKDYNASELKAIFCQMAKKDAYQIDAQADQYLTGHFKKMYQTRGSKFANGREVRNYYQKVITKRVRRVMRLSRDDDKILVEDIRMEQKKPAGAPAQDRLMDLVGLSSVKEEVQELISLANYQKMCQDAGIDAAPVSLHLVFTGNPGTGKTTVARLVAEIYHDIGLLPSNTCIETDRAGLVGKHVGETAIKTQEVIERANGGVLFIDEAYTLTSDSKQDFGQEAIDTILKAMEDNRESLVVIIAGYTQEMKGFIASNPGLQSRFTKTVHFEDYDPQELEDIFYHQARQKLSPEAACELPRIIGRIYDSRGENFGNGREIRNFYETVLKKLALRVSTSRGLPKEEWNVIQREDLIAAENTYFKTQAPKTKPKKPIGFHFD